MGGVWVEVKEVWGYMENFKILKFWGFPQSEIEQLVNKIDVIAIYNIWKQIRLEPKTTYKLGE
jgi:hypothetical protein